MMDTKWDKIGGTKNKGTEGRKEQRKWEMELASTYGTHAYGGTSTQKPSLQRGLAERGRR